MISNNNLLIKYCQDRNKYQLRKKSFSINDNGEIIENEDFLGYFTTSKEADNYANR